MLFFRKNNNIFEVHKLKYKKMTDLSTKYMGFNLKSPIIAGSSGITNTVQNIKHIAKAGAGAVVIKSIFEEQTNHDIDNLINKNADKNIMPFVQGFEDIMNSRSYDYAEATDYLRDYAKEHTLVEYLNFVEEAKKSVDIPVIASINCVFAYNWHYFAKRLESAGADAIELNLMMLPSDLKRTSEENEEFYDDVIKVVREYTNLPISIKIGYYFSSLGKKLIEISKSGISGMVLFNRPYSPDINLDTFEITQSNIFSDPHEYSQSLRWISILSDKTECDLAAATGVHDSDSAIKLLLAGANAVQVTSALYKHGIDYISTLNAGIENWMKSKNFTNINDFRGKLSQKNLENPAAYERVQFMKFYANIF